MSTVTLADAQERLEELVHNLPLEGEIVITLGDRPVARLAAISECTTLRDHKPASVGGILKRYPDPDDDLLGEMLAQR